jgi:hypothetical protein
MAFAKTVAPLVAGVLLTSACATSPRGIFRTFNLNDGNVSVATDARQRMILAREPNVESRPGLVSPYSIICAEPSPDVATAVASSFGTGLSVLGQGTTTMSAEVAEGLLQLGERTASIQLMRDMMYRACESYANGAITGTNYTLLMGQITETMITLLLGETAGGAFGRSQGALGSRASAEANAQLAGFMGGVTDIQEAAARLADAELDVQAAQADFSRISEEKKETPNDQAITDARNKLARLTGERDALKTLLQGELEASSEAAGEFTTVRAGGGITTTPDAATAAVLGEMQRSFIDRDSSQTLIQACLVELGMWNTADGVADILLEPARKLAALEESIRNYNRDDNDAASGALLIATSRMERTGLFDFCETYFPSLAAEVYRTNAAIRLEHVAQQARAQEVRWLEVRGNAATALASALDQCERIADPPARERCKALILEVEDARLPEQSARSIALRESLLASGGENTLPTRNFELAVAAFVRLQTGIAALNAATVEQVSEVAGDADDRRRTERGVLDTARTARLSSANAVVTAHPDFATEATKAPKRDALVKYERDQIDLSNRLAVEPDPVERRIRVAELDRARAIAEREAERYDVLKAQFDGESNEIDRLVRDIVRFNAD